MIMELVDVWCRHLRPGSFLSVAEWSEQNRILSTKASAEPGPYRLSRTPYMREILDALSPYHPARKVVFMKAAQVGATEAGNNWIGYIIDRAPGPILIVQPSLEMARRFVRQRLDALMTETDAVKSKLYRKSRSHVFTILLREFQGGVIIVTSANSALGLRSMPVRYLFLDEVDAYPPVLANEGDPVALAEARTKTFGPRAKIFMASTPTIAGVSRIENEYLRSDRRLFYVPCPFCGTYQALVFERLIWPENEPDKAIYECAHCGRAISEEHKPEMLAAGEWRPTATPQEHGVFGYHLNGLYSPYGWLSWAEIARRWEQASTEDERRTVKNTLLGETWRETGDVPDWQRLYERREPYRLGEVPDGVLVLTAGADVQRDRIEVSVWGWGARLQSWLIDHVVFEGDTATSSNPVWERLSAFLHRSWPITTGGELRLSKFAIDAGDGATTQIVYDWCRRQERDLVMAVKGFESWNRSAPVDGPSYIERTIRGRKVKTGVALWKVATSTLKAETYSWLRISRPTDEQIAEEGWPIGFIHFPSDTSSEFLKQLTAEQLVVVRNRRGFAKREWHKTRPRNEALDCRVYARAAAIVLRVDKLQQHTKESDEQNTNIARPKAEPAVVVRPPKKESWW